MLFYTRKLILINVCLVQDIDIRKKDCDEIQQSIQFAQQVYRERLGLKIDLVHSSGSAF
jgi:hypothetical protein